MVAIHIPRPADEWPPARQPAPDTVAEPVAEPVPVRRRSRPLPDRATRIRRRRLAALVVLVLLVSSLAAGVRAVSGLASAGGSSGPEQVEPRATATGAGPVAGTEYVVQPGDTLWSIAAQIAPDDDPRVVVDALRAANGRVDLQVGTRLDLDIG